MALNLNSDSSKFPIKCKDKWKHLVEQGLKKFDFHVLFRSIQEISSIKQEYPVGLEKGVWPNRRKESYAAKNEESERESWNVTRQNWAFGKPVKFVTDIMPHSGEIRNNEYLYERICKWVLGAIIDSRRNKMILQSKYYQNPPANNE